MRNRFTWFGTRYIVISSGLLILGSTPVFTATGTDDPPPDARREFKTDFSKHIIPFSEIKSGGPPKDGIPAIENPSFITIEEADEWLEPVEPVVLLKINGDARAYPLQVLMWHEISNDIVGSVPVVVTFCPLCNTAIAFERQLDCRVFDFGTTGRLRNSNLIMYDRQTETWWQQATGEGIVGELTGSKLNVLPAAIISWKDFKTSHPDGKILSRDTGFNRNYGRNPYLGYDDISKSPFLHQGATTDGRLPPMARVLAVEISGDAIAFPYYVLQNTHVINSGAGGKPIAVFWHSGTASALDVSTVAEGRDVGTANTYFRELNGTIYTFQYKDEQIVDDQTGSQWNVLGEAIGGNLAGQHLIPIPSINHFWFSWAAFKPNARVYWP